MLILSDLRLPDCLTAISPRSVSSWWHFLRGSHYPYRNPRSATAAWSDGEYAPGLIFQLKAEQRITLARAQELGRTNGRCIRCHAKLTDPKSVTTGIGPVCATFDGLPLRLSYSPSAIRDT
jgi:hypothetical protein